MQLIRRNDPFSGLTSLHSQIDDMFNDLFSMPGAVTQSMPAMDVYTEDDKQLVAELHAPGFDKDDIDVSVHNGVLEISAEKQDREEQKDGSTSKSKRTYMVRESSASFYRRIALPKHSDGDSVQASFDDGLLKVIVPFKELPKPKKIQIGSGKNSGK